jgi:penicillin-binding protein 1A
VIQIMTRSRVLRALLALSLLVAVCAAGGAWWFYDTFLHDLPDLQRIEDYAPKQTSVVLDRHGRVIGEFAEERRRLVPIDEIPKHVQLAFVSAEDGSFFEHEGLDYRGILRAALANLRRGGAKSQGASTITQQMVKSLLLSPEKTYRRKIREMILARDIEKRFTKQEILYLYLNQIYFGEGAWGVEEASRAYFGKSVRQIGVSEAALLAGLPQRPSEYSPYRNPLLAEKRRRYVLRRMLADGVIDEATFELAFASPPKLAHPEETEFFGPAAHFTELVRRYLYDRLGGSELLGNGLTIETTLDIDLQVAAVASVRSGLQAHDHRQGYRGVLRTAARGDFDSELEQLATENAEHFIPLFADDLGIEVLPSEGETEGVVEVDTRAASSLAEAGEATDEADLLAEAAAELEAAQAAEAAVQSGEGAPEDEPDPEMPVPLALEMPFDEPMTGIVLSVSRKEERAIVSFGDDVVGTLSLADVSWARKPDPKARPIPVKYIDWIVKPGDVARFVRLPDQPADEDDDASDTFSSRPIYDPSLDAETLATLAEQDAMPEPLALLPVPRLDLYQEPMVQGALLSMEVDTGDVLALVGGYDYERSEFNRAVQAKRQPGSAFKPFIYGAALARGYTPVSEVVDRPVVYTDPVSGFVWAPRNYGRTFYGPMPLRNALKKSVNNATVHLFREVGVDYVIDYARRLGIQAPLSRDLSLALGSSSVTLLELTTAYAVFPNHGRRVVPRFIRRVLDAEGGVLLEDVPLGPPPPPVLKPLEDAVAAFDDGSGAEAEDAARTTAVDDLSVYPDAEIMPTDQIIPEAEAYLMCDLLRAVVEEGTGRRLKRLGRPLAGKTGTTNEQGDAWFMGFSPEIVTGVWVGNDDNTVLGWGETGAGAALPIWGGFMKVALEGIPIHDFDVPKENIVFERIDRDTGLVADGQTADAYYQPFIAGTAPKRTVGERNVATDAEEALREDLF